MTPALALVLAVAPALAAAPALALLTLMETAASVFGMELVPAYFLALAIAVPLGSEWALTVDLLLILPYSLAMSSFLAQALALAQVILYCIQETVLPGFVCRFCMHHRYLWLYQSEHLKYVQYIQHISDIAGSRRSVVNLGTKFWHLPVEVTQFLAPE